MLYLCTIFFGIIIGWGMGAFPVSEEQNIFVLTTVFLLGSVLVSYLIVKYGWSVGLGFCLVGLLGIIVEYIAITTCFPYGCFGYSNLVGPRMLDTFPYTLLVIWPILVSCAFARTSAKKVLGAIIQGTILLVLFDIFLDPVAVHQGIRAYDPLGVWYGVPVSNYLGWIPISFFSILLYTQFAQKTQGDILLRHLGILFATQYITYFSVYIIGF